MNWDIIFNAIVIWAVLFFIIYWIYYVLRLAIRLFSKEKKEFKQQNNQPSQAVEPTTINGDFIGFDVETANENRESICAIGIVHYKSGEIIYENKWLVKPEPLIFSERNTAIHGIKKEDVENAKTFPEIWEEIKHFFNAKNIIVCHNASFDIDCLCKLLIKYNLKDIVFFVYVCTYKLSKMYVDSLSYALNAVCEKLNIDLEHHDPVSDAKASLNIFLQIAPKKLVKNGILNITNDFSGNSETMFMTMNLKTNSNSFNLGYSSWQSKERKELTARNLPITISIGLTKSKYYDDAINLMQKQTSYKKTGEGKNIIHSADFQSNDEKKWREIFKYTQNWKSRKITIEGKEYKSSDISSAFYLMTLVESERNMTYNHEISEGRITELIQLFEQH